MEKNSNEYILERQRVDDQYIKPLLEALKGAEDRNYNCFFTSLKSIKVCPVRFIRSMLYDDFQDAITFYDDPTVRPVDSKIQDLLNKNKTLEDAFNRLRAFYIGGPDEDKAKRGFMVRGLLFEELNLFPALRPVHVNTNTLKDSKSASQSQQSDSLPHEIQIEISNFFQNDADTIKSYRASSKTLYGIQKKRQDRVSNIFYAVTKPVAIQEFIPGSGFNDGDTTYRKVTDNELRTAVNSIQPEDRVILFKTPYEAIEYAHTLKIGGTYGDKDRTGVMPAVMMVSTLGDSSSLQFNDKIFESKTRCIYHRLSKLNYLSTWASVAEVSAKDIQPLVAVLLCNKYRSFGDYRIFNKQLHLNPLPLQSKTPSKQEALDFAVLNLTLKAQELANKAYLDESNALLHYLRDLSSYLKRLKLNLKSNGKNKNEELQAFKRQCAQDYKAVRKAVENHRGWNHVVAECFFSVITLGVYLVAMIANKLFGQEKRFTFFSTDTVNQLDRLQHKLDDYNNSLLTVNPSS